MKYVGFDVSNSKMMNIELYDTETEIMNSMSKEIQPLQMTFNAFYFQFDYLLEITDNEYKNYLKDGISTKYVNDYMLFLKDNNHYHYLI